MRLAGGHRRPDDRRTTCSPHYPQKDFRRLLPYMTTVPIRLKQVLHQAGEPLRAVYFLNGGAASIVTLLSDGTMVEATTVGNEGMLGIEAFLSVGAVATGQTLMQVPDTDAERLSVEDFRREVVAGGALHDVDRALHASDPRAADAIHGVQREARGAATVRPLAADDARPDAAARLQSQP